MIQRRNESTILTILLSIIFILLGIIILRNPGISILAASLYLGIGLIARGIFSAIAYFRFNDYTEGWRKYFPIVYGILLVILGILFLANPGFTVTFITYLIALWFILEGVLGIYFYSQLNITGGRKVLGIILSLLILLGGIFMVFNPLSAIITLDLILGFTFIFQGILALVVHFSHDRE